MKTTELELSPMDRFWRLLKPDQKEIRNVYAYAIFNGLVGLSLPLGIQAIVNLIQGGQISTSWIMLVVFVVLGVAVTGILQIFQLRITEDLQQKIFTRAAFEFSYRIPRIKMEAIYKHYAPELMNRFFDVMSVQKGLSKILIDFSSAVLQVIFGLLLLSFYHPFFIIFSLILILLVFVIFRFTARRGLEASLLESKHKYQVAHWLEELARTSNSFKLLGSSNLPLERTDSEVSQYLWARESHFKILVQQYSLMVIFKVLVATGLLAIGGILVMEQLMNIGQFIAAEIIILLVMASVEKLILSLETIYDVLTGLEKVGQVTDLELEEENGVDLVDHCEEGGINFEFKEVSFKYPGQKHNVLEDINMKVNRGEKVVISGQNASGRSTMLQLIAGLYESNEGIISFEGLPLSNIKSSSLRRVIGDSLSQEVLFEGSLLENITMGREGLGLKDAQWASDMLGMNEFVQSLPHGFQTKLKAEGRKLPRSMVQKVLLARGIVGKPKLLLVEDSLEHIDEVERKRISAALMESFLPWTLVLISNEDYAKKMADKIIHLDKGRIAKIEERKK